MPKSSTVGRYEVRDQIGSGGMATVHLGRLRGTAGFSKTVAIKRLYPQFAEAPELVSTLLDEAHLVSRIQHPNVVSTLDIVAAGEELCVVMEYVHGESLARLCRADGVGRPLPVDIATGVLVGALHGLHAAHEAVSEDGEPLGIVHRDVSPQNIIVGTDGLPRVLDFGVAKAKGRLQTTRDGQIKGKLAYMAPEQVSAGGVSRRTDVFAAGVVLWEALTGERLFDGEHEGEVLGKVITAPIEPPSASVPELSAGLDRVVLKALQRDPDQRFDTARQFALALADAAEPAPAWVIGDWVQETAAAALAERSEIVSALERGVDLAAPSEQASDPDAPTLPNAGSPDSSPAERAPVESSSGLADSTTPRAHTLASSDPPIRPRSPRTIIAVAALLALALAASMLWSTRSRPTSSRLSSGLAKGARVSLAEGQGRIRDVRPSAPASTAAVAVGEVAIEVHTTPAGATVGVGSQRHGPTPVTFRLPVGADPVELVVSLPGRATQVRELVPNQAHRLELVLLPSRAAGARQPSTKPTPTSQPFDRFD